MKLNPDCLRGVLLTVEENCDFNKSWSYAKDNYDSVYLAKYDHAEILYHINQCDQANFFTSVKYYDCGENIIIYDLAPAGHDFLANIRNDSVWKKIISKFSDSTVSTLVELAKQVALKNILS